MSSDYGIIRDNVNNLKLIQLGLTFCKEDGTVADDCPSWQFNFRFDPQLIVFSCIHSIDLTFVILKRLIFSSLQVSIFLNMLLKELTLFALVNY